MRRLIKRLLLTPPVVSGVAFDTDATNFLTTANITDPTTRTAINNLVVSLKSNGLWNSMLCIHPMVGGTSLTCSYNLVSPLSYQVTWSNLTSGNFTSNGVTGNGSGFGTIPLNPTSLGFNDLSFGAYLRNNITTANTVIGTTDAGLKVGISPRTANIFYGRANVTNSATVANSDSSGFICVSSQGTTVNQLYRNGTQLASVTGRTFSLTNGNILLLQAGGGSNFSFSNMALSYVGRELSSTQMGTLYTLIQNFQTALGRNV